MAEQNDRTRQLCLVLVLAVSLLAAVGQSWFSAVCSQVRDDTVRLHIVAASDTVKDQSVKLLVRDAVLRHADRLCSGAKTQAQARQILAASLPQLGRTVQRVLTRAGCALPVHLAMERTYFATAHYPGATLPAGTYDALRIVLGDGRGHNWWCCLYPELCLAAAGRYDTQSENAIVTAGGYEVRFAVVEWWQKWLRGKKDADRPKAGTSRTDAAYPEGKEVHCTMAKPEYFARSQKGSSGPDVALIQTWLSGMEKVYPCIKPVGVDGKFGSKTVTAVKRFQCMSDLSVDGVVGRASWDALYETYAAAFSPGEQYPGVPLRAGDRGAVVKSAQCRLLGRGYTLKADGDMGPNTVAAVREFQKLSGLSADGVVGKMTWTALYT